MAHNQAKHLRGLHFAILGQPRVTFMRGATPCALTSGGNLVYSPHWKACRCWCSYVYLADSSRHCPLNRLGVGEGNRLFMSWLVVIVEWGVLDGEAGRDHDVGLPGASGLCFVWLVLKG